MNPKPTDLKELVNNLTIGVYRRTLGLKSKFIFANEILSNIFGFSMSEIYKINVADLFDDKIRFKALNEKIIRFGGLKNEELRLKRSDGKDVWCSVSSVVVRDSSGKALWIDGIFEDISIQKRVSAALEESKELFRTVFNNSAAAITVTDKNEKIMAWNPFAEKMLDMNKEDLFNKPVKELYPPEEWRKLRSYQIRQRGMLSDIESKIFKKDGQLLDVNMSLTVLKDVNGNMTGAIGIMRDTTKQKLAERTLRESENKIRIILENSPVAIMLTDADGNIVSWNRFAEYLLGRGEREMNLKHISSLYPEAEWKKIKAELVKKRGSKNRIETQAVRKDGSVIEIDLSVNVLKDSSNEIIGSVGIMQDITEQKHSQQMLLEAKLAAEKANKAKSLFLANMSHEVRTPMNTIMGLIDLTLDTDLSKEQSDNLKTVKDAADNLLSLLNDILDLSRVEAGKINLEMIDINLRNVVDSVCKGLTLLASKKGINLVWEMDESVPEVLVGDSVRIRQILVNLINNAIKFTFKGNIKLTVKVLNVDEHDCELEFAVSDQGIGISPDKQKTIFDVFTQADDSTTRQFGGTGLGLAICKRLVEMMGGRIWVESEALKGSTFHFTAKLRTVKITKEAKDSSSKGDDEKEISLKTDADVKQLSILLAEDNIVNQKIAAKLLEKRGWNVTAVDNGQKVLDVLEKENFDVILMDAQMPVLDGFETTKIIRKNEESTGEHIPIIALTARAMTEDKKKCFDVGMDGYVAKPIDRVKFYESIESIVKKGSVDE